MTNTAYIGLGSNLESPVTQLRSAYQAILSHPSISSITPSSLYNTTPIGPQDQPNYINGAIKITTSLSAIELLDTLQSIENQHGRVRTQRWGARTLDLDILLFNNEQIDTPRLTVPHPQIEFRNFVLVPLNDLSPDLIFPDKRSLKELLSSCPENAIELIPEQKIQ